MKNCLSITFAYLAAVIGAGFASGSEIVFYFLKFGRISILGVFLAAAGFGIMAWLILLTCTQRGISSFGELAECIMPPPAAAFISAVFMIFMTVMLGAMISAFVHMSGFITGLGGAASSLIFCLLCFLVLLLPSEKIIKWSSCLGVFIVVFICGICVYLINNRCVNVFSDFVSMNISAGAYTAYNTFAVCPMLCEMSVRIKTKRQCAAVGIMSAVLSFAALFLLWCIIAVFYGKINLGDMPMLTIAARQGKIFCLLYSSVIFAAVLTSAAANGFGIYLRMKKVKLSKFLKLACIMTAGAFVASIGFSNIVDKLYKAAGFASVILPLYLVYNIIKNSDFIHKTEKTRDI